MITITKTNDLKVLASTVIKDGKLITGGIHFKKHPLGGILITVTDGFTLTSLYDEEGIWDEDRDVFMLEGTKELFKHILPYNSRLTTFTPGEGLFKVKETDFPFKVLIPCTEDKSNRLAEGAYIAEPVIKRVNEIAKKLKAGCPCLNLNDLGPIEITFTGRDDLYMIAMPIVNRLKQEFKRPDFIKKVVGD